MLANLQENRNWRAERDNKRRVTVSASICSDYTYPEISTYFLFFFLQISEHQNFKKDLAWYSVKCDCNFEDLAITKNSVLKNRFTPRFHQIHFPNPLDENERI